MATRNKEFQTISSQGALLPPDILRRISDGNVDGMRGEDFGLPSGFKRNEAISQAWGRARAHWLDFQKARESVSSDERTGATITRTKWLLPLLEILGFGKIPHSAGPEIEGKQYPINYCWTSVPMHLLGCKIPIDRRSAGVAGAATGSPHSLVQEFLNRSDDHLWAILSNGLKLRLLRDNVSLSRQAFVEFDLESMMDGEVYSDFGMMWTLLHVSRLEGEKPEDCWLEVWTKLVDEEGARILGDLRLGVTKAIESLGQGFLGHPENDDLRDALRNGELPTQELYRQILRTVYRLLFLLVAEDRNLLHLPEATDEQRRLFHQHYSLSRIRDMADKMRGTGHRDLWYSLSLLFGWLDTDGCAALGVPPLGSFLWNKSTTKYLLGPGQACGGNAVAHLANDDLLNAIRFLGFATVDGVRRPIDYKNLGAEELGSVYESLLELTPTVRAGETAESSRFSLSITAGNERKTSGSYYTPDSLVQCLLDSALEPVVKDRLSACTTVEEREKALLSLTVCDPAVGSGHFLIAAAHRLAGTLASIRTGDQEAAPEDYRHALRDVISNCLYGVDINPMSAELCRVALWMEAMEPGKALAFLDHRIMVGNSLIGATPQGLSGGIPDGAFKPIEGDDKKHCAVLKKANKQKREDRLKGQSLFSFASGPEQDDLADKAKLVGASGGDSLEDQQRQAAQYGALVGDPIWRQRKLACDAWCAAFMWKKDGSELAKKCPSDSDVQRILTEPDFREANPEQVTEIDRLATEYGFFHWHLAYPHVLAWHESPPVPAVANA
jgi:hypothetical protein